MVDQDDSEKSVDSADGNVTAAPEVDVVNIPELSLLEAWPTYSLHEKLETFAALPRHDAEDLYLSLTPGDQADIFLGLSQQSRRSWIRLLAPDDAADLIQVLPENSRFEAIGLLDNQTMREVTALLAYAEDNAGGLMNSRFARLRPDMTVEQAIRYLRAQTRAQVETIYYAYVLDAEQKLLGIVSLRQLFLATPDKLMQDIMVTDLVTIPEQMDQERISRLFSIKDLMAIPVVDAHGRMKGIVTVDDIVDVFEEEATEDFHKIGGTEALEAPYLQTSILEMVRKRAPWLLVLFVGEMFTATAMGYYEHEIQRAVVLALFIPLIISSGGNSGSQASTLIIRAMALGELRLRDWWRVFAREIVSGLALGIILGIVGYLRIWLFPVQEGLMGEHQMYVAATVALSLLGTVLWGTLTGSLLPFILRFFRLDPATASAPFVATLVDVTGLVIYFSLANVLLAGRLL